MVSFDDLGAALRDDAATNAPRASAIDVDAVTHAARARRRPRQWAVGTLSVVAALGLGGIVVAAVTPPAMIAASDSSDGIDLLTEESAEGGAVAPMEPNAGADGSLFCGAEVPAMDPARVDLALEVRLLSSLPDSSGIVEGVALVTNTAASAVSLMSAREAMGVLVQSARVVGERSLLTEPSLTLELEPGEVGELPVRISTNSCADGTALAAGDYTVAVTLPFIDTTSVERDWLVAPLVPLRVD